MVREPLFRAVTPDGRWVVCVEHENECRFFGTVLLDGKDPTDTLTTDDPDKILRWARRQMEQAMRRTA